jgi:hypothetical protein
MRRINPIFAMVVVLGLICTVRAASPRQALNMVLPELNFTGVTLADAIDFMRDVSGANMHVNWPALEAAGIGKDTTINLRLRNVSLRKVLQLTLREAGAGDLLSFYIDDGIIEITTKELADEEMFTRVYPVDDLIMEVPDFVGPDFNIQGTSVGGSGGGGGLFGGDAGGQDDGQTKTRLERAEELIEIIQAVIEPDVWDVNGGRAAIRFFNGALIVTAPRSVHEALGGSVD